MSGTAKSKDRYPALAAEKLRINCLFEMRNSCFARLILKSCAFEQIKQGVCFIRCQLAESCLLFLSIGHIFRGEAV